MYQKGVMAVGDSWTWAEDELRRLFSEMIPKESTKRQICILVDALDESGVDTAIELVGWLEKINKSAKKIRWSLEDLLHLQTLPYHLLRHQKHDQYGRG